MYSWIDRPLSLADRIYFLNKDKKIEKKLVDIDEDLLYIPSVAIHIRRDINTQPSLNPANRHHSDDIFIRKNWTLAIFYPQN
jgi:aspartyl aminopeptidase